MVALRKRQRPQEQREPAPAPEKIESEIPALAVPPAAPEPVSAAPADDRAKLSAAPAALQPPHDENALLRRLAELEQAQMLSQQLIAAQQQQIAAHMQLSPEERIARLAIPESAKAWLAAHPEYLSDASKNQRIGQLHQEAMDLGGHEAFSPSYYEYIERAEGLRPQQAEAPPAPKREPTVRHMPPPPQLATEIRPADKPVPPARIGPVVSAPPVRESVSLSNGRPSPGRIHLSPAEREIARMSGISEADYARGKQRMEERRRNGLLQDGS
jgi:hypothetical protein